MSRLFLLSSHVCAGESGGGHGVIYRLCEADHKYGYLGTEAIYVFRDLVLEGNEKTTDVSFSQLVHKSEFRKGIRAFIPNRLRIIKMKKTIQGIREYLEKLDQRYAFSEDDVYVFHDFRIAYAFLTSYPFRRTAFVFHMQGSIYYEWHAETGISSHAMKKYFDSLFIEIVKQVKFLCFPSHGTEESLIASEPEMEPHVSQTERRYLYNGVYCPEINTDELPEWVGNIGKKEGFKFVSIANLNKAKAIERIPRFLGELQRRNVPFYWILVGNGVQSGEVENEIQKYAIKDHVTWIKEPVPHHQLMALLSITDFYILFHRYSIFDLSTLEAMHYGNIPVLTPVGGNREMIIRDNGVFVGDFTDVSGVMKIISDGSLKEKRKLNMEIQNEEFDDRAFLKRYVGLYHQLCGEK